MYSFETPVVATGRRPEVAWLHLAKPVWTTTSVGIRVDQNLKTSQANIDAAGDVIGSFQFTHYAGWQGYAAARNALFAGSASRVAQTVTWAVFSQPELAQVGLTEELARAQGRKVTVSRLALERVDRAQTSGDTDGFIKIVASPSGKVLGGTIVRPSRPNWPTSSRSPSRAASIFGDSLRPCMSIQPSGSGIQQIASDFALKRARTGLRGAVPQALMTRFHR